MNGLSQLNHADLLAWNGAVGSTSPPRGGHVLPIEPWGPPRHLEREKIFEIRPSIENKATSRWRGGPHGSIGRTRPPRGGEVDPTAHRQNMATSRCRGGPHDSIPCKQIGVVELAQAIHAVSGPGHLEVTSVRLWLVALLYRRSRRHNAGRGWHRKTTGKLEVNGSRREHECQTRNGKRRVTTGNIAPS
ncbi:hypothetical protein V6N13_072306 [Hibiscus sabdariffa]